MLLEFKSDLTDVGSAIGKQFIRDDLDYLKSRILTHRSINGAGIIQSRYYEAAKTMVSVIGVVAMNPRGIRARHLSATISVPDSDSEIGDEASYALVTMIADVRRGPNDFVPVRFDLEYTNHRCINGFGLFFFRIAGINDDGTIHHETYIGHDRSIDILESNVLKIGPIGTVNPITPCIEASMALKYSENFPTPSVMCSTVDHVLTVLIHRKK